MKNLGKSVGLAGIDAMKELNPVITDTVSANKEFVAENYSKVKEFVKSEDGLKNSGYYKSSKKLISNALKEFRTGEIYSKESNEKMFGEMAEGFGINMKDFDMDFGDLLDEDKSVSKSKTSSDEENFFDSSSEIDNTSDGTQVDVTNNNTRTLNRNVINNIMMSGGSSNKGTNKILSSSSRAMLQANMQSTTALLQGIHTITTFQNETTVQFYNDVSSKLAEIGNALSNVSNMFGAGNKDDEYPLYDNAIDDLMVNGLKLDFYKRQFLKNKSKIGDGDMDLFMEMALPIFQGVAENPLGTLLKGGMKAMLPKNFKDSMSRLNDSVSSIPLALQFLLKKWKGSDNKIKQTLGSLFGIDFTEKSKLNFGKYEKGAIAFDGVTKRAIVNVIPSLLGKILSAVSDDPLYKEELVYDYDKGQFSTKQTIRQHMKQRLQDETLDSQVGDFKKMVMKQFKPQQLTEGLTEEINNAFKLIVSQGLTPDSSLEFGGLSKNKEVENAIRQMYGGLHNSDKKTFQKNVFQGLSNRRNIYDDINKNYSYQNAYDVDNRMISKIKKKDEEERKKKLEEGMFSLLGIPSISRNSGGGIFDTLISLVDKTTNTLDDFLYGDNEKGKITQKVKAMDEDDNDLFGNSSIANISNQYSSNKRSNRGRKTKREIDIMTRTVNLYSDKIDGLPKYDVGTKYVKEDQVAEIHKGERILTAEQNKDFDKMKKQISNIENGGSKGRTIDTDDLDDVTIEQNEKGKSKFSISGKNILGFLKDKLDNKVFKPLSNTFTKYISDPLKKAWNKGKNFFLDSIVSPIKEAFQPIKDNMKAWFNKKKQGVKDWFSEKFLGGKSWGQIWSGFKNKIKGNVNTGVGKVTLGLGRLGNKMSRDLEGKEKIHKLSSAQRRKEAMKRRDGIEQDVDAKDTTDFSKNNLNQRLLKFKAQKRLTNAKKKTEDIVSNSKEVIDNIILKSKNIVSDVKEKISSDNNSSNVKTSKAKSKTTWQDRINTIDKNVNIIKDTLIDFYNAFLISNGIKAETPKERSKGGFFGRIKDKLKGKFDSLKEMISNPFGKIKEKMKGKFNFLKDIFGIPKKVINGIKDTGKKLFKGIKDFTDLVVGKIPKVIEGVKNIAEKLYTDAKNVVTKIGKGLGKAFDSAVSGVKTLYGDIKSVGKELWGTTKSAVGTVWDRFFGEGGGKKGRKGKTKSMEVFINGGYLDGIRETLGVNFVRKSSSYEDTKKKMEAESKEDLLENNQTDSKGDEAREKSKSRMDAFRERTKNFFNGTMDVLKTAFNESWLGKKLGDIKERVSTKFQQGKQKLGTKLAGNQKSGFFGGMSRAIGKKLLGPQSVQSLESQGITPVHIMGTNVEGIGTAGSTAGGAGSLGLTGDKNKEIRKSLFNKFYDSKLGQKFFASKMGSSTLDVMTNGKGFMGNAKELGKSAVDKTIEKLKLVNAKKNIMFESMQEKKGVMKRIGYKMKNLISIEGFKLATEKATTIFNATKDRIIGGVKRGIELAGTGFKTAMNVVKALPGGVLIAGALAAAGLATVAVLANKAKKSAEAGNDPDGGGDISLSQNVKSAKSKSDKEEKKAEAKKKKEEKKSLKKSNEYGSTAETSENRRTYKDNSKSTASKLSIEEQAEKENMANGIIPFVAPTLFESSRNLILAYRHNKKREEIAEKKLLQQMTPQEREAYLASKSNSEVLSGKSKNNPLSLLANLFGMGSKSSSKKGGLFGSIGKTISKFTKKATGLLGISAIGSLSSDEDKKSGNIFTNTFSKMKNFLSGKGWKTDDEIELGGGNSNGAGSSGGISGGSISLSGDDVGDISDLQEKQRKFINMALPGAILGYKRYGVIPSLTLAQGALESGWGANSVGNNLFGIKADSSWKGKKKQAWTTEYDANGNPYRTQAWFRDYDTMEDSVADHAKFLADNPRYAKVLTSTNIRDAAQAVASAGYATSPTYSSQIMEIVNGSRLDRWDNKALSGGFDSNINANSNSKIVSAARTQLGVPYVWGGTSPGKGLDCSGLTQYAYKQAGVNLSRTTYTQVNEGKEIPKSQAKPGDLIFSNWSNSTTPEHVSIYTGENRRIHAPQTGDVVKEVNNLPSGRLMFRRIGSGGPLMELGKSKTPSKGVLTSLFGRRKDPLTGKDAFHSGIDIANNEGTPILAYDSGIVEFAGNNDEYGNMIKLRHRNGLSTVYGHNSMLNVREGDSVDKNSIIARMGSTGRANGSHLHFEMQKNGRFINPSTYQNSLSSMSSIKNANNNTSAVSSVYSNVNDIEKMEKYTEMINIMNAIAENTGTTNELLEKMFKLIDSKFKNDDEVVKQTQITKSNPFLSGVDPDIEMIAQGV